MQPEDLVMNAEEWKAYLGAIQDNHAIDEHSVTQYASLILSLNATVRDAAAKLLRFENEPASFIQALRELSQ
jgi:hypothetical protein